MKLFAWVNRMNVVGAVFALMGVLIIGQMARVQSGASAADLLQASQEMEGQWQTIIPARGAIYDRYGRLLAGNQQVYEVGVNLQVEVDAKAIADVMVRVTGADYATMLAAASLPYKKGSSEYAVLKNFVTADQITELERTKKQYAEMPAPRRGQKNPSLNGLMWTPYLIRSYPEQALASNILGFYAYRDREQGKGYFGVEEKYNDLLAGTPRKVWVPFDPNQAETLPEVPPGSDLVLTIDRAIQASVERILDKAVADTGSDNGAIIVENPRTGEILAMANTPRVNLNEYWTYTDIFPNAALFNRSVNMTYEPGSVFKVLTMAAALDSGTVKPETEFLDTGVFQIGGAYIYNWDGSAWGPQDMTGCMRHSLNVCLAWLASEMGPSVFYDYIKAFGIGHPTGVDLAGEASYPLRLPGDSQWYEVDLGTNSFGQGLSTTPVQMVMATSAVANDGKMMMPHILKSRVTNGRQYNTNPQVIGQPISKETANALSEMLANSLEGESMSEALVEGYRVAGKTGTAEIATQYGYSSDLTNASFVGWGPVDDPQFLVYVWLEKPRTSKWGSVVAAPVFRDVVKELVVLLDLPPDAVRLQMAAGTNIPPTPTSEPAPDQ